MTRGPTALPRLLRILLLVASLGLLGGCSVIQGWLGDDDAKRKPAAESDETPGPPAYDVRIEAPGGLAALLEAHLDLVRLRTLAEGRNLEPSEWNRLLSSVPEQARSLLQTEGYFDADVKVRAEGGGDKPVVHVSVTPGPRTTVGRLRIELQGEVEDDLQRDDPAAQALRDGLVARWPLKDGAPFVDSVWSGAKTSIVAELRAAGYFSATLSGASARILAEERRADLYVVVDSGPAFHAGDIVVQGLEVHDEQTVRNLAGIHRGQMLTESLLLDYQERLIGSNLFGGATVIADNDPQNAQAARITVQVSETQLQQATFGVGVSANTGPRATMDYTHRRPFGLAAILRNQIEYGQDLKSDSLDLSSHPGEDFYRNTLGVQWQRLYSDTDIVRSTRVRVGRTQQTTRIERFYFVEAEDSKRSVTVASTERPEDVQALSLNYQWVWRDLDSILLPTRGVSLSLQGGVGVAQSPQARRGPFSRVYGRLTGYRPFGDWYGSARIELGEVFAADSVITPDSQRFRAGGDDSVRGYAYRSLAPTSGIVVSSGNMLLTGSVEMARPIIASLPDLWGAVFVDMGRAADSWGGLDPAFGYGVGVRYRSPLGPVRVDLAYGEEVREWRVHFSIGVTF